MGTVNMVKLFEVIFRNIELINKNKFRIDNEI